MNKPKFCKDCKWFVLLPELDYTFGQCSHPKIVYLNKVNGQEENGLCSIERVTFGGKCGSSGKLWEEIQ